MRHWRYGALALTDAMLAVLLGTISAVGGGTVRDILLSRIPAILQLDVYATAAMLGALIVVLGLTRELPRAPVMLVGAVACFVLRMVSFGLH